ncbi:hypothetical protein CEXT_264701 [Caerostris extrusa]|uniref:Uncharacterized protein n=1 Tax=Caerostris extrusa TaxID=172846 RepID=A0AAV4U227_CAEEX|nr:hypothetical protein CEXT_264701 [Caerostris extrusa]
MNDRKTRHGINATRERKGGKKLRVPPDMSFSCTCPGLIKMDGPSAPEGVDDGPLRNARRHSLPSHRIIPNPITKAVEVCVPVFWSYGRSY